MRVLITEGTGFIGQSLCPRLAPRPPETLISASAVGYYGEQGDRPITEDTDRPDVAEAFKRAVAAIIGERSSSHGLE